MTFSSLDLRVQIENVNAGEERGDRRGQGHTKKVGAREGILIVEDGESVEKIFKSFSKFFLL